MQAVDSLVFNKLNSFLNCISTSDINPIRSNQANLFRRLSESNHDIIPPEDQPYRRDHFNLRMESQENQLDDPWIEMAKNTQQLTKANAANQQQVAARQAQAQQLRQVEYHEVEANASAQVCVLSTSPSYREYRWKQAIHWFEFCQHVKQEARKIFKPPYHESQLYLWCSDYNSVISLPLLAQPKICHY